MAIGKIVPTILPVSLLMAMVLGAFGCGASTAECQGGFERSLNETWRPYCDEMWQHLENPAGFELLELTTFFTAVPDDVRAVEEEIRGAANKQSCFSTSAEKVEYKRLRSCLVDNELRQQAIINAWRFRARGWLREYELDEQVLKIRVADLLKTEDRLLRKTLEAFSYKGEVNFSDYEEFLSLIDDTAARYDRLNDVSRVYDSLVQISQNNPVLLQEVRTLLEGKISFLESSALRHKREINQLRETARYLAYAVPATAAPCPSTKIKRSKERKVAAKALRGKMNEFSTQFVGVSSKIVSEDDGESQSESFRGFLCGPRAKADQFRGKPQLCTVFSFELGREKPSGSKWNKWQVTSFEESGKEDGVNCALIE
jgi:hypothetical protein